MSVGERIKHIRLKGNIKQGDMADKIGIKQGSLSDIERGRVKSVTDRVIKDICREYKINEEWIRTGNGEMTDITEDFLETVSLNAYDLDELDKKIITEYIRLSPDHRKIFKEFIRKMTI